MGSIASCCCPDEKSVTQTYTSMQYAIPGQCETPNSIQIDKNRFTILKLLGVGEYSKVFLVQKQNSSTLFAMKVLKKRELDEKKQKFHTISEKNILQSSKSPFIVKLKYSFQDTKNLYLVMEFIQGGELLNQLRKQGKFTEDEAKFYICEILIAIEYLHNNGVIYRDLKPGNVLIDEEGHIKLTDFGLSFKGIDDLNSQAYTICGSDCYLAPEVIKNQGYNKAVDYWSLGVLFYEMITGFSPFRADRREDVYKKIVGREVEMSGYVTCGASDLIDKLLTVDPGLRMERCAGIKGHFFFIGVDWELVQKKMVRPPFRPRLASPLDLKYFENKSHILDSQETLSSCLDSSSYIYQDFTYNHEEKD